MRGMDYRDGYADGFANGYAQGIMAGSQDALGVRPAPGVGEALALSQPKKKRKASAYSRRYGAAYRRLRRKHTLKSGKLRKGYTHKRLVKLAHAEAKKGGRKK